MSAIETHQYLLKQAKKYQPLLFALLKKQGALSFPKQKKRPLFEYMAETIVGQQLSLKAADTIWLRLVKLAQNDNQLLLDYLHSRSIEEIKTAGVSGNKAKALTALAIDFKEERLDEKSLKKCTHQERSKILLNCWGIGQWSCDMISMFYYQDPDIWPKTDGGVMSAIRQVLVQPQLKSDETDEMAEPFSPHRSLLAYHLWQSLNNKLTK